MADQRLAHPANAPGDFYVDSSCMGCDVCRQLAPEYFGDCPGQASKAVVALQP